MLSIATSRSECRRRIDWLHKNDRYPRAGGKKMTDPNALVQDLKTVAEIAATPIVSRLFERLGNRIEQGTKAFVDKATVSLQLGFSDFLQISFERCRSFKNILSRDVSLDLVDNYIHVTLSCGSEIVKDVDLIAAVESRKAIVITGLAGSGKSMFMRFLTVKRFIEPNGSIPLFVDLRRLNQSEHSNIKDFIREYCSSASGSVSKDQFNLALQAGYIILILDGFDEINYEYRSKVEEQILILKKDFPTTTIVVSSRPDNRFGSWASFDVFKVNPLSKQQCIDLINGLHYEEGVKTRFVGEVEERLYSSHTSFLSSPLLTTIMLLTYEQFADIPDRMYSFYGQAFDTLFQRHDALKEQFQRKTYTGLPREEFIACFAAFCSMSYLEQRFSFNEASLHHLAEKAIQYARNNNANIRKSVTADNFLSDLHSSVCMLHQDGIEVAFVHRSFQEYFSAVFAVETHGRKTKRLLDQFSHRLGDSVVSMALEMDREGIEQKWVIPVIADLEEAFFSEELGGNVALAFAKAIPRLALYHGKANRFVDFLDIDLSIVGPLETLRSVFSKQMKDVSFPLLHSISARMIDQVLKSNVEHLGENMIAIRAASNAWTNATRAQKRQLNPFSIIDVNADDDWWFKELGMYRMFDDLKRALIAIRKDIQVRERKKSALLDEFFS